MSASTRLVETLANILGIDAQFLLIDLEHRATYAWFDVARLGASTAAGFGLQLEELQRSYPAHMPLRLRFIDEKKDLIVFRANWVLKAHKDDSGNPVRAKSFRVGKATHATDMGELRAFCPADFWPLVEDTEARLTFIRAELHRLSMLGSIANRMLELGTDIHAVRRGMDEASVAKLGEPSAS